jgi:hypothetical protein
MISCVLRVGTELTPVRVTVTWVKRKLTLVPLRRLFPSLPFRGFGPKSKLEPELLKAETQAPQIVGYE